MRKGHYVLFENSEIVMKAVTTVRTNFLWCHEE